MVKKLIKKKIIKSDDNRGGLRLKSKFKKDKKNLPLISVVMPNFKSKSLKKSINSVLKQTYKNVELIIVDGASGKSTLKILKKYNNKIDFWISEKDKGMWDAWNKGIKNANGKFVGIVDSSNILYPNAMKILSEYIVKNPSIDFFCGTIIKDGKAIGGFRPERIYRKFNIIPSSVVSFFIKKKSLDKVGYLNLKYKIQSDYDLLYRMIVSHKLKGMQTKGEEIFGDLGDSGFSKKHSFFYKLYIEVIIRFNNKQNILLIIYIIIGRSIKKLFK
jgi:glycosyltransferase involved in cell wall biosynthesis|tara:strand:- start:1384 stop:2202 length:819 start_codon:yes stop_codon:yes gene_type:complete